MHRTSYLKCESFVETYVHPRAEKQGTLRVLDIGSKSYEGQTSYKDLFTQARVEYVGLDLESGRNVDFVPQHGFLWNELERETFDFCISGQTFEHNPFFWVTMAEIARVLKPGGTVLIVAPGRGRVHRFPVDCWRFFPDSWQSLCAYTGLELVESYFEDFRYERVEAGSPWCDSCMIARKPELADDAAEEAFYASLERIIATLPAESELDIDADAPLGKCMQLYESKVGVSAIRAFARRLRPGPLLGRVFRQF